MEQLKRELHLIPAPPNVVGAALVIPAGLLLREESAYGRPGTFARDPEAIRRVENLAMRAVMNSEWELGNEPRDVSKENHARI